LGTGWCNIAASWLFELRAVRDRGCEMLAVDCCRTAYTCPVCVKRARAIHLAYCLCNSKTPTGKIGSGDSQEGLLGRSCMTRTVMSNLMKAPLKAAHIGPADSLCFDGKVLPCDRCGMNPAHSSARKPSGARE
jgi:hypothetical protein